MTATRFRQKASPYVYILPSVVFMGVFVLVPILISVYMGFFKMRSLTAEWQFVGLQNFAAAFRDNDFLYALLRTLGFGAFSLVTNLVFGLLIAMLVHRHKLLNFYRYIFYLPAVVSGVTMGRLWQLMLAPDAFGLMNVVVMKLFGLATPVNWLGSESVTYLVVMGIGLVGVGGGMTLVLFTTALNNIPEDLLEAARVEGANAWTLALKIKIPMIMPTISAWLVLTIIGSFKSFEFIYALTGGGPSKTTTTIGILLYNSSKLSSSGYGMPAAMGLILTLIICLFSFTYMFLSKMNEETSVEM